MTKQMKAILGLLIVTVFWGTSFPIMSVALDGNIEPFTYLAFRFTLAGVILSAIYYKRLIKVDRRTLRAGIILGLCLAVASALQIVGVKYTTASKAGFITGLNVVIVPVILSIVYKKMPDIKTILGVVFSVSGLYVMSLNGAMSLNIGDFLTLLCAFGYAIQIILVDKYAKGVDVMALSCIEFLVVGISGLPFAAFVEKFKMDVNVISIGAILFTAIFCTIVAFGIQNRVQHYINPTHAAIIFLAEPVFGAFFSLFIGERLTGKTLVGCLLIFLGMIVMNIQIKKRRREYEGTVL